jgi:hypothetical protein
MYDSSIGLPIASRDAIEAQAKEAADAIRASNAKKSQNRTWWRLSGKPD